MTTRPKAPPSAMDRQELERVPLGEVRFHPENKRRGDVPRIVESIRTSGWFGACGRQKSTRLYIWGNHRAMAAQEAAALITRAQSGAWVGTSEEEQELIDSFVMEEKPGWCDVILARAQRLTGHVPTRNGEPHDFGRT